MEKFCTLNSSEKTIAFLGGRWWPPGEKQKGDEVQGQIPGPCNVTVREKLFSAQNVGGVSIRSKHGAVSKVLRG